eukprot:756659-Hanusia_phi.AAC.3
MSMLIVLVIVEYQRYARTNLKKSMFCLISLELNASVMRESSMIQGRKENNAAAGPALSAETGNKSGNDEVEGTKGARRSRRPERLSRVETHRRQNKEYLLESPEVVALLVIVLQDFQIPEVGRSRTRKKDSHQHVQEPLYLLMGEYQDSVMMGSVLPSSLSKAHHSWHHNSMAHSRPEKRAFTIRFTEFASCGKYPISTERLDRQVRQPNAELALNLSPQPISPKILYSSPSSPH